MAQIEWTSQSLDDIEAICTFIEKDSVYYARLFASNCFEETEILYNFPLSGRIVPEYNQEDVREILFGNYRIVYRFLENKNLCQVLTVQHGAKLLKLPLS